MDHKRYSLEQDEIAIDAETGLVASETKHDVISLSGVDSCDEMQNEKDKSLISWVIKPKTESISF